MVDLVGELRLNARLADEIDAYDLTRNEVDDPFDVLLSRIRRRSTASRGSIALNGILPLRPNSQNSAHGSPKSKRRPLTSGLNLNTMVSLLTTTTEDHRRPDTEGIAMADNGFLSSRNSGTTYIRPIGRDWKKVTYSVVGDLAIFEGCIVLGTVAEMDEVAEFVKLHPEVLAKEAEPFGAAIKGVQYRWKNKTVPYEIDGRLRDKQRVKDAISHWVEKTTFKFIERTNANRADPALADYVLFREGDGCASTVGRKGGRQDIILGSACTAGNCIHEIGHTIGLWHEQSRIDRDDFITINKDNIDPGMLHNFDQHVTDGIDLGAYDYGSIMHYPKDAFSQNGGDTIVPKQVGATIGQRVGLSAGDIAAVKQLYP